MSELLNIQVFTFIIMYLLLNKIASFACILSGGGGRNGKHREGFRQFFSPQYLKTFSEPFGVKLNEFHVLVVIAGCRYELLDVALSVHEVSGPIWLLRK